jgi:hypothetical protein
MSVFVSVCQRLGSAKDSEPVSGVQASMKIRAPNSQHAPPDAATACTNLRAGPSSCCSMRAQAETTAIAIPAANQAINRGSVSSSNKRDGG